MERGQTRPKGAKAGASRGLQAGGRRRAGPRRCGLQLLAAHDRRAAGIDAGSIEAGPATATAAPIPTQREHQRILAAYNGAYDDPKLESLLNRMVAKLVAASERPDVAYRVTILNSAAVNAFALPTGQLYVTRGLIALANDTSELASVLSHEMSHVIARHAAIREDQARQVALVEPRRARRAERSGNRRAGTRQIQDRACELLARTGIRGRRHRRRHRGARGI